MVADTVPDLIIILVIQVDCEQNPIAKFHVRHSIRIAFILIINFILREKIAFPGLFEEQSDVLSDFLHEFAKVELLVIVMEIGGRVDWNICGVELIEIEKLRVLFGGYVIGDENCLVIKCLYSILSL